MKQYGKGLRTGTLIVVLALAGVRPLVASDAAPSAVPRLVAAPAEILEELNPGVDAYNESHALMRDGRQEEAIARGTEAIEYFEGVVSETADAQTARVAYYYLAHAYLDIIVDVNTWLRFNGRYEQVRSVLSAYKDEDDYRFVEGKRYALYPPEAGGDPNQALAMFGGIEDRFELTYHKALAMFALGDVDGAIDALSCVTNPAPVESAFLRRIEVERREPRVTSVVFTKGLRTRESVLERVTLLEAGKPLASDRAAETVSRLENLPVVASADLAYDFDPRGNEVVVNVDVREGKHRMVGVLAYGAYAPERDGLAPDADASAAMPLLFYSDQNLFGRMVQLDVVTAGVYSQLGLSFPGVLGSPVAIRTGVESMALPLDTLEFADAAGDVMDTFSVDRGAQAAWIGADAALGLLSAGAEYRTSFSIYDESSIDNDVDAPRDLRHSVSARIGADMRSDIAAGAAREGFALTVSTAFTTYSGFETWGAPGFRNDSPDGPGTVTYGINADAGWRLGKRGDIGIEMGAYSGTDFFTRELYSVGAPGPGSDSALWVRGYPVGVRAERAAVAHARAGYEIVPGSVHVGAFHDTAVVDVPDWISGSEGLMNAGGIAVSFALPWSIQAKVTYSHSYHSLDGDTRGGRDIFEVALMRMTGF